MKQRNKPSKNAAFSLLEMAITLTIISLVIAAVLTGQRMKHRQELNQIISDISNINSAVTQFKDTYGGSLPGDLLNATDVLSSSTSNGNGDGYIVSGTPEEPLLFWQHLQLAGLVSGTYDGVTYGSGGVMETPLKYGFYFAFKNSGVQPWQNRLYMQVTKFGAVGLFTAKEAYDFDTKYDDGNPSISSTASTISSADGTGETAGSCITGGAYNLATVTGTPCAMYFYLE